MVKLCNSSCHYVLFFPNAIFIVLTSLGETAAKENQKSPEDMLLRKLKKMSNHSFIKDDASNPKGSDSVYMNYIKEHVMKEVKIIETRSLLW